jgi:hypothetical protein
MRRSRQMARAGIEPATPRFSVVDRGAIAGHGWRLPPKISLQIGSIASIATCGPLSRDTALVRARGRQVDVRGAHSARVSADAHEARREYPHHIRHSGYLRLRRHASVATTRESGTPPAVGEGARASSAGSYGRQARSSPPQGWGLLSRPGPPRGLLEWGGLEPPGSGRFPRVSFSGGAARTES